MLHHRHRLSTPAVLVVQASCLLFVAASIAGRLVPDEPILPAPTVSADRVIPVPRAQAHRIEPLYDDPELVSDAELAAVLAKVLPRFGRDQMQPNYLEHALRAWGVEATFADEDVLSGAAMRDFLLDRRLQIEVYGQDSRPLLIDRARGIGIRWEPPRGPHSDASAHHDHLLASLSEAGVSREQPVFPPSGRQFTFDEVLQESVRDFRLDELETEWSVLAWALWFAPETTRFQTGDGRVITFDLLARRLMRSQKNLGVCSGTHRVYTLLVLWRLNEEFDRQVISDDTREEIWLYLESVRDAIAACQFEDGRWPSNWADGRRALNNPIHDEEHRQVIATGHHLEWLALAPRELHPPRAQILKAADWLIATATGYPDEHIRGQYTFYSHIGNALALWRRTTPAKFWSEWTAAPGDRAQVLEPPAGDPLPPAPSPLPPPPTP